MRVKISRLFVAILVLIMLSSILVQTTRSSAVSRTETSGRIGKLMHSGSGATDQHATVKLTSMEQQWINKNKSRKFILGLDPMAGMEHFVYDGHTYGYIYDLVSAIQRDLGIKIKVEANKSWGEVFSGLSNSTVDILIGANETAERKQYMSFTRPIYKYPYAFFSYKDNNIETIGDIDGKEVGFLEGDIVVDLMSQLYKNVKYKPVYYTSQDDAMKALAQSKVDAFITSGGEVAYEYIQRYPQIRYISKINTITSDMTLSTRKEDEMLAKILDKELEVLENSEIKKMLAAAEIMYNRKLMLLSKSERKWLEEDGTAVVGITKDYLPIDYFSNGNYLGISGAILNEIARRTGIHFKYRYEDFETLYQGMEKGEVNVLNLAKTEERLSKFYYPRPYLLERDTIYGRKEVPDVLDVYGLEGKSVAVVKGFWHYELLKKNLSSVKIIDTSTIQESMEMVHSGKADYFIENPSVVRYYLEELDMYDIMQKGATSNDSYLYFGISKNKPELASIIDKVIPLLDIQELAREGFNQVPRKSTFEKNYKLFLIIIGLLIALGALVYTLIRVFRLLVKDRSELMLMKVKEEYLYMDSLTGFFNRNYLNDKVIPDLNEEESLALIVCDMNNLKTVNDKYGHHMGDMLLKAYSDFLRRTASEELLIRLGGDEFLIIMPGCTGEDAAALIQRIESAPKEHITASDGTNVEIWGAYGYSVQSTSAFTSITDMIKEADQHMYASKRHQKAMVTGVGTAGMGTAGMGTVHKNS